MYFFDFFKKSALSHKSYHTSAADSDGFVRTPFTFVIHNAARPPLHCTNVETLLTLLFVPPNRTYGGVGGKSCEAPPYPDELAILFSLTEQVRMCACTLEH